MGRCAARPALHCTIATDSAAPPKPPPRSAAGLTGRGGSAATASAARCKGRSCAAGGKGMGRETGGQAGERTAREDSRRQLFAAAFAEQARVRPKPCQVKASQVHSSLQAPNPAQRGEQSSNQKSGHTFLTMGTYDSTMFWAQSVEKAKILSLSLQAQTKGCGLGAGSGVCVGVVGH